MAYEIFVISDLPTNATGVFPATSPAKIALEWSKDFEAVNAPGLASFWRDISRTLKKGRIITGPALDTAMKHAESNLTYGTWDMKAEARILVRALRAMK